MADGKLSIGQASKRTGIPVKTLRFYSDQGLVPPSGRSRSGYRLYSETDLAKLDLVRTLRDAGLGLPAIGQVLRHEQSLRDVLHLRLGAIEAHIVSLRNVASALRAALHHGEPTEADLRRLYTVTHLTNEERKAQITRFYDRISDGIAMDSGWKEQMIDALSPKLPDDPSPEQLDAWIELSELIADPDFIATMRALSLDTWKQNFDSVAFQRASTEAADAATVALANGFGPDSAEARRIVERLLHASAAAYGKSVDAAFRSEFMLRFKQHDPRASRLWELSAILNGRPSEPAKWKWIEEWKWLTAASVQHLGAQAPAKMSA